MSKIQDIISGLRLHGLTQSEISRMTGISQPKISRWESGEVPNSANDAIALLDLAAERGVLIQASPKTKSTSDHAPA